MSTKITTVSVLFMFFFMAIRSSGTVEFIFDGEWSRNNKNGMNLMLSGNSTIDKLGFLKLTDATAQLAVGHAFYSTPIPFKNSSKGNSTNKTSSFSTTFVFAISHSPDSYGGHGLAFAIAPSKFLPGAFPTQYLGLFNSTTNGYASNHVFAIEFDTIQNPEWGDINRNHVGIDINSLVSLNATSPYYYTDGGEAEVLELASGEPLQVWVDYDGEKQQLNVYIAPAKQPKPTKPLLSPTIDLSGIVLEDMYVGFSASTGEITSTHYICGWSFKMEGEAPTLNLSNLSLLPSPLSSGGQSKKKSNVLKIVLPVIFVVIFLVVISGVVVKVRSIRSVEELEDWEKEYGPHRFAYKDLFTATKGFAAREVLGTGGFGKVYRGVLRTSKIEIAVKRVSHESSQGMREFVAEIVSLGHLRHRNLVQLLGYCRRHEELLIVYEYVPNGSLDKHLFNQNSSLSWKQRIGIVHGVASGLLYLHEEWDQVVLHRDIKASNVLLDGDYNARLGDFGLARLYSHGSMPETTHVAGTLGYIAPEFARTGKSTTCTDVFAFGTFMLEVVTGRRPVDPRWPTEEQILGDWVLQCWRRGSILEAMDPKLGSQYVVEEVEMVLKLGLFCSHPVAAARPSMPQVMQFLEGDASLPQLSDYDLYIILEAGKNGGNLDNVMCKDLQSRVNWSSIGASVLLGGR